MSPITRQSALIAALSASLLAGCQEPRGSTSLSPLESRGEGRISAGSGDEGPLVDQDWLVESAEITIPDEELVDQDGAPVRLGALMGRSVTAVNFIFTTCTTVCSPMTAIFARLQAELGPALERDVRLISISLDPVVDTPEALRRYADRFGRRRGWTFLTGSSERLARVRRALSGETSAKEGHRPMTLIGSASEGRWVRVYGVTPVPRLAAQIRSLWPQAALPDENARPRAADPIVPGKR